MGLSAAIAANSKLQLIPVVAVGCLFAMPLVWSWVNEHRGDGLARRFHYQRFLAIIFACVIIFFVPLKNIALHGNPAYPVNLTVFGFALPHAERVFSDEPATETQNRKESKLSAWLSSVLELEMGPLFDVRRWSLDSTPPPEVGKGRYGGLFGYYVMFQAGLAALLLLRMDARSKAAFATLVFTSVALAILLPGWVILRYYMFWFVCLIAANLFFVSTAMGKFSQRLIGVISLGFVLVVIDVTDQNFIRPKFYSLDDLMKDRIKQTVLEQLTPNSQICLALDRVYEPFLYASLWHSKGSYAVKAGPGFWPQDGHTKPDWTANSAPVLDACGDWKVVFSPRD